ncbi:MAG: cytochrome c oxidase assembly protein [Hyphomicrobiales bacterium]|nr:cytochrome c oxidase assembly protein [Hyphomicrobiales bacterium]
MDREKTPPRPVTIDPRRNLRVAGYVLGGTLFMLGMSFAAVPLYDLFCRVTGYGGTTQVAVKAPDRMTERLFTIRMDANVAPGLGWLFEPEMPTVSVKGGEVRTVSYTIRNATDRTVTGIASYNVSPDQAGAWFNKIACFCFNEITLHPGESRTEEVVFFVDPEISKEKNLDFLQTITLSYTFFPAKNASKPLADAASALAPAR